MNKQPQQKYVTQTSFDKEVKGLHQKIDNVALALLNTQEDVRQIKETMSTKDDIRTILNTIDTYSKRMTAFDQEERVQSLQLVEVRQEVENHEKRLVKLESVQ